MIKLKDLKNDPKKSILRKEKEDCRYYIWSGVNGCHIRRMKNCRLCPFYEVKHGKD